VNKHRPLSFVIGLGLGATIVFSGGTVALGATAAGPLPDCAYDDVLTPYRAYTDWQSTLLDTTFMVGSHYVPPRLVSVNEAGIAGRGRVRPLVVKDLFSMKWAAFKAGKPIEVVSAYRSFEDQQQTFRSWVKTDGYDKALATSARAGHSEHQLGTTLDFKTKGGRAPWLVKDWATTPAGAWMKANAWKYGFVMTYPKGERRNTCYSYEPWHFRYFGRALAAAMHDADLTSRQYLWRNGFGLL
jgi:D-alanyl-D-alanine carboxypeptidase